MEILVCLQLCTSSNIHPLSPLISLIIGLTNYTTRAHLCRAVLEAVCFQSREVRLLFTTCYVSCAA